MTSVILDREEWCLIRGIPLIMRDNSPSLIFDMMLVQMAKADTDPSDDPVPRLQLMIVCCIVQLLQEIPSLQIDTKPRSPPKVGDCVGRIGNHVCMMFDKQGLPEFCICAIECWFGTQAALSQFSYKLYSHILSFGRTGRFRISTRQRVCEV